MSKSLYEILGFEADQKDVTSAEIKAAYRKLAKECHPDKFPNNKEKETQFQEITDAYDILMDKDKRAIYDETGQTKFMAQSLLDRKAMAGLKTLFNQVFDKIPFEKIQEVSIVQHVGVSIVETRDAQKALEKEIKEDIIKIKAVMQRLSYGGEGKDYVREHFSERIKAAESIIKNIPDTLQVLKRMEELLEDYQYATMNWSRLLAGIDPESKDVYQFTIRIGG